MSLYRNLSRGCSFALLLAALSIMLPSAFSCHAASPAQSAYTTLLAKLQAPAGVSMKFSASGDGAAAKGTALLKGAKFQIRLTDGTAVWCDAKNMWTYNPRTKETTLTSPSATELAQTNPAIAIARNPALFTPALIKAADGGRVLQLSPAKGKTALGLSCVWIRLNTDGTPASIRVKSADGRQGAMKIESFSHANAQDNDFRYPASKYKGVQVLDLR